MSDDPIIDAVLAKFVDGTGVQPQRRKQVPRRVGTPAKRAPAIPRTYAQGDRAEHQDRYRAALAGTETRADIRRLAAKIEKLTARDPGHPDLVKLHAELGTARQKLKDLGTF